MPTVKETIRELAQHAIAKKGARQSSSDDVLECPDVELSGHTEWTKFFQAHEELMDGNEMIWESCACIPVVAGRLKEHQKRYPMIRGTPHYVERDGHIEMTVPLNAGIPIEFIKSLIDEAHAIVWNKLDADDRLKIELAGRPYDEPELMDALIGLHKLKDHQKEIREIARHAILLRTRQSSEAKIPVGATKIGGRPDLPAKTEWPAYRDGKPLAFLAQIDLAEIANLGTPIKGLPADGMLSLFSVWGWIEEGNLDPQTPEDRTQPSQEDNGWTVVLHTTSPTKLERRQSPRGVNSFKAAAVEPIPILSLPNHRIEPPLASLDWSDDVYDRFDEMQSDYRSIQMGHWLKNSGVLASHHLLGGYALFQQEFPEEVLEKGLTMLLQIGTDDKSEMAWGDGGELTFYANAKALAKGRFERVWGTCQGG